MNLIKKIFSPVFLTVSFLFLIYTFYKSEIYFDGFKRYLYSIYYLISFILIFFSIISFFINEKIKDYLIISVISTVLSIYISEGYLSLNKKFLKNQLSKERLYFNQTGNKWDKRSRLEIYEDLKKINNEIAISVGPSNYVLKNYTFTPLSGVSNSETIHCNENGYYSIYKSDRYGFNNPNSEWDKEEIEYLLVGDSYTYGDCVNRPDDISSVLRNLTNKSVLNLAQDGNGPLIEYATLREYLDKNVKKVLWIYYEGNDLKNLIFEKNNITLMNYLNDLRFNQNLKFKQDKVDDLVRKVIKNKIIEARARDKKNFKAKLIKFIKMHNTRNLIIPTPNPQVPPEFKKVLKLAKKLSEENNSKLYFVYLPEYYRYRSNYNNTNYNLLKKIVSELNIDFIDKHKEVFEKEKNPLKLFPFELDGHYNVQGNKKVAETILKFTKN